MPPTIRNRPTFWHGPAACRVVSGDQSGPGATHASGDGTVGRAADVRMRGFATRSTVEAALAWVDGAARVLESESVPAADAHGRVMARPAVARWDVPAFVRGAMDGYAVRAEDTLGAGSYNPLSLRVIGESLPVVRAGNCRTGQCVRIMTGAPLPDGADAVVPVELTEASSLAPLANSERGGRGRVTVPANERNTFSSWRGSHPASMWGGSGKMSWRGARCSRPVECSGRRTWACWRR